MGYYIYIYILTLINLEELTFCRKENLVGYEYFIEFSNLKYEVLFNKLKFLFM